MGIQNTIHTKNMYTLAIVGIKFFYVILFIFLNENEKAT